MEKNILVIYTGGTIGMIKDEISGTLKPFNFENIYSHIPMLKLFNYHIDFYTFPNLIDSSNVSIEFWVELASCIEKNYEDYDGFVVLHGSDTMSYTASALSFMLKNLNKPVILTGSQLPLGVIRTDGRDNIINAIEVSAAYDEDTPIIPEVCICFENRIYRGNRTFKNNAENFQAFMSPNYPPLAEVGVKIKYNIDAILKPNFKKLSVLKTLDNNIAVLKLFPGIRPEIIRSVVDTPGLKALVIETYGSGNAPTSLKFIEELTRAINKKILIVNVTQCKSGSVQMGKYETGKQLEEIGVLGGFDITTESAVSKLMYLFGIEKEISEIKILFQKSIRGEMSVENEMKN